MATGVNKVILMGNIGKDPEVKHFEGGAAKASFTLATSEYYKDKNGNRVDKTEWHNIVLWRSQAEFAEKYLKKGFTIYLEGKIRHRQWEDQNQVKKFITEIEGETINIVNRNDRKDENQAAHAISNSTPETPTGDDLPF